MFSYSAAPLRPVKQIQFSVLDPQTTKQMSVVRIEHYETMDGQVPKQGGLLDPRMGTIDRNFKCNTCMENMQDCPGHFGHLELQTPVFHPGFIRKVKKTLESTCYYCSKLLVENSTTIRAGKLKDKKRTFQMVWEQCKGKTVCLNDQDHNGCGQKQPVFRQEALKLVANFKASTDDQGTVPAHTIEMTPQKCLDILRLISDDDAIKMGMNPKFARPEWMILTILPVPPMPVRPSIQNDGTGRGEDDLTHKLSDIIKANISLSKHVLDGAPQHIVRELENLLQYHVATYMDNDISGIPPSQQKNGRQIKSIRARLKGKEGRLRGNLMGKRVDFSARTVITGDPNLSIDQVGVPRSIAKNLTFPETVTPYNIDILQQMVQNGTEHPGAKYVIRENGERIDLRYSKRGGDVHLQYGYKVERHLLDDDLVIFNRQPSLHKMSMMGHRVKIMPYSTFRLHFITQVESQCYFAVQCRFRWRRDELARAAIARDKS